MERDAFLARIRDSLERGAHGPLPAIPEPYRPPATSPRHERIDRLIAELEAVGVLVHRVVTADAARGAIVGILGERRARSIVRGNTSLIRDLDLDPALQSVGLEVTVCDGRSGDPEAPRRAALQADAGICSVDVAVAETGSLAILARAQQSRSVSLLPPLHVAILDADDVVQELAALFARVEEENLPSAVTLITGPSRTGDIELVLTVGVHGPGELHLVLIDRL